MKNKQILIVEDSPTQAQQLQRILEQGGHRVHAARNGQQALELISQNKPDLIISDIVMPEMDGYELCRRIRESEKWHRIPVVLLTALSDPDDIIKGLSCGADNFVTKPFNEAYLLHRIEYLFANEKFRSYEPASMGVEIVFGEKKHFITSDKLQILNLLLFTFETAVQKNKELIRAQAELQALNDELEERVRRRTADLTREVAERRQAEERSREQAALLDKATDAIFVCDLDGCVRYWSHGSRRIYGWSEAEVAGKSVRQILQADPTLIEAAVKELLHHGEWFGEITQQTKEGKTVVAQSRWTLLRDANGNPKSVLAINTDITEKKQNEAKFLRIQRLESLGALAGGIAHDLNNALTPILMGAEMLRENLVGKENLNLLDTMLNGAQRGADMVRQILSFSRGVSGEHVVLQLKHLLADMQKFARSTFPHSIRLETQIAKDLFPVLGDATQLHQVLLNLFVNARDAMPAGGTLLVEAKNVIVDESFAARQAVGPHATLTVSDTGHGIPEDLLQKIFEPFFTTKELGKGTGLGLSTVMGIVKTHRGFTTVSSEVGKGASFHVFLPAAEAKVPVATPKRPTPPSGNGELVLIVDDEKAVLQMTVLTLEAWNYRVLTAHDGIEALAVFEKHQREIKVVLTDMMMPNLNGPELVRKLREISPDLRIIGVSGLGSEAALSKPGSDVVRTFLRKPFPPEALLLKLREVLGTPNRSN